MHKGQRLRQLRKQKKLTQEGLEDHSGVNQASISSAESGKTSLSLESALKLSRFFGVPLDELYDGDGNLGLNEYNSSVREPAPKYETDKSMQKWNEIGESLSPESRKKAEKLLAQIFEDELDSVKTQKKIS